MPLCLRHAARLAETLLESLAPRRCVGCGGTPLGAEPLCAGCDAKLRRPAPAAVGGVPVIAAATYAEPIVSAIHRLKYRARPDLAHPLAQLILREVQSLRGLRLVLVPVPVHTTRLVERGYNQAALLASALRAAGPWDWAPQALIRKTCSRQQAGLSRVERLTTLPDDFQAQRSARVRGRKVLLVDDVVTTGATAYSCIAALRAAGARVVAVAAIARAAGVAEYP